MAETCPTCKSDDKTIHRGYQCGHPDCPCTGGWLHECTDPWHDAKEEKIGFGPPFQGPAQATREQLEAALKEIGNLIGRPVPEYYSATEQRQAFQQIRDEISQIVAERLLGGK